ncbi:hypothetical protein HRbin27_02013 [bacterium HR27]|nr:hypothetical protein HRbin27_02013 [bacterium HR27]
MQRESRGSARSPLGTGLLLIIAFTVASLTIGGAWATAQAQTGTQTAIVLPPGDPIRGKEYFTGVLRFENGGPPCQACHSIGGIGALGGGQLGPDLTPLGAAVAQNEAARSVVAEILTPPDFGGRPTMRAVWTPHPLTAQEKADVIAFLGQAAVARRPAGVLLILLAIATVGTVLFWLITLVVWRKRLVEVRRPLYEQAYAAWVRRARQA